MTARQRDQSESNDLAREKVEFSQGQTPLDVTGAGVIPSQPKPDDVPDGGALAWLQVVGSWLLFFNSW